MPLKVFELYSGIGGMHCALRESGIHAEVIKAVDINSTANAVYKENFGTKILQEKNIQDLTEKDFNLIHIDMILMSPPCQPHTRNGLKKDKSDRRSESLIHIIDLLPRLESLRYILLENVKGFENSEVRNDLINVLKECQFSFQEFLLTPTQFSIPNSRMRYYLLAKKKPLQFCFDVELCIMSELPPIQDNVKSVISKLNKKYKTLCVDKSCFEIKNILEKKVEENTLVSDQILKKYATLFDIVTEKCNRSCCFTKAYGHFVEGAGSVFSPKDVTYVEKVFQTLKCYPQIPDKSLQVLKSLELRYFTPKEISKLMGFPENFKFPNFLTIKQKFRLLGNSLNVHVVAILINLLVN